MCPGNLLFTDSSSRNIAFGTPQATEDQIREAARLAHLLPDVEGFPREVGYDHRGAGDYAFWRAATADRNCQGADPNPKILILDDALSSVDTVTEERILNALRGVDARSDLDPH